VNPEGAPERKTFFLKETFYNPSEKEYSSTRNEQIGDRISSFIISAVAGAMKSINQS
jgi:hypothetical protein